MGDGSQQWLSTEDKIAKIHKQHEQQLAARDKRIAELDLENGRLLSDLADEIERRTESIRKANEMTRRAVKRQEQHSQTQNLHNKIGSEIIAELEAQLNDDALGMIIHDNRKLRAWQRRAVEVLRKARYQDERLGGEDIEVVDQLVREAEGEAS